MKYQIVFQKAALKFLRKQDRKTQKHLLTEISKLPSGSDIKHLRGYDMYRLRVGTMRVLYTIDNTIQIISIENIDSRGEIYKKI